jgi:hypothetical protein
VTIKQLKKELEKWFDDAVVSGYVSIWPPDATKPEHTIELDE